MPRVSITNAALRELRDRMAQRDCPSGIWIIGPLQEDCRAPASVEDAWLIEKLYGAPPRWILDIVPVEALEQPRVERGESFHVETVQDIAVGILTSKTVERLSIELHGDTIRVFERDEDTFR